MQKNDFAVTIGVWKDLYIESNHIMTALQRYPQTLIASNPSFEELVRIVEKTVAASSARVYRQTFGKWARWAATNTLSPFALTPANVAAFLEGQDATKSTKQRQLSALRKLVEMLSILDYTNPEWSALHMALKKNPGTAYRRGHRTQQAGADPRRSR